MEFLLIIILSVIILFIVGYVSFLIIRKRKITKLTHSLDIVLFSVKMPKYEKKEEKEKKQDIKSMIGMMEQIYSNFLYLERPKFIKRFLYGLPRITLEIASEIGGSDISFYIAIPSNLEFIQILMSSSLIPYIKPAS